VYSSHSIISFVIGFPIVTGGGGGVGGGGGLLHPENA
jgi:hypothetical protein